MKYALNEDSQLFRELAKNPIWWQNLKNDPEIYCDIRKDNHINIYYNGGSIMRLDYLNGFRPVTEPPVAFPIIFQYPDLQHKPTPHPRSGPNPHQLLIRCRLLKPLVRSIVTAGRPI